MRAKAPDGAGRVRPVTIGFRVTRDQNAEIDDLVAISGMTKQDYIVSRLTERSIVVTPNARVQQALARRMDRVYAELRRIGSEAPDGSIAQVTYEQIAQVCGEDKSTWGARMQCESSTAWTVYSVAVGQAIQ